MTTGTSHDKRALTVTRKVIEIFVVFVHFAFSFQKFVLLSQVKNKQQQKKNSERVVAANSDMTTNNSPIKIPSKFSAHYMIVIYSISLSSGVGKELFFDRLVCSLIINLVNVNSL